MAHWSDYSLRGWLSFLAFMHIGLCLRSFLDQNFLFGKVFYETLQKDIVLVHYFSIHSLTQAFILIQSAVHLYVLPIQMISIFMLILFICINLMEAFYFQTLDLYGGTLLPFAMSVISLAWLIMFHFVWKPWLSLEINEDSSSIRYSGFVSVTSNHHSSHKRHKPPRIRISNNNNNNNAENISHHTFAKYSSSQLHSE